MGKRCVMLEYDFLGLWGEENTRCNVVLSESGSLPMLLRLNVLVNLFVAICGWLYKCTEL
jgi:hypothetical protein